MVNKKGNPGYANQGKWVKPGDINRIRGQSVVDVNKQLIQNSQRVHVIVTETFVAQSKLTNVQKVSLLTGSVEGRTLGEVGEEAGEAVEVVEVGLGGV